MNDELKRIRKNIVRANRDTSPAFYVEEVRKVTRKESSI
jgi:hypothetical protein